MIRQVPDLNTHLTHAFRADDVATVRTIVDRLLRIGTCFAVISDVLEVRTTERGAKEIEILIERQH